MTQKTIFVVGEMNEAALSRFYELFLEADEKEGPTTVVLSSCGGDIESGTAMYEILRTSKQPVHTVGVGEVASIAVLVLVAGDKRTMTEGSTLLIHDGSCAVEGPLLKVQDRMVETMRQHNWYCQQLSESSGMSLTDVLLLADRESFLSADDALEYGFVDEVRLYRPRNKKAA